ncbi:hypothetical protein [Kitasatospora sp. NPDC059327]|uniref:hypothetical protein n=1 Tax=Kitasatospora sp. NPDC059327 TaxID=3346803 RepID=UPI00367B54E2
MAGWVLVSLTEPRIADPGDPDPGARLGLWSSFQGYMAGSPGMLLFVGAPSMILLVLISGRRTKLPGDEFKVLAGALLLLPVVLLVPVGSWMMIIVQIAVQALFVAFLMPAGRSDREATG